MAMEQTSRIAREAGAEGHPLSYGSGYLTFGEPGHVGWIRRCVSSLLPGQKIIDVGAGPQRYRDLCSHLVYVSQDSCEYDGRGNGRGAQNERWDTSRTDIVSDICSIPVANGAFDAALCVSVLEHVPDPCRALREIARILAPGGKLFLTAPFAGVTHQAPFHYYTGFPRYFYEHHLSEDFVIDECVPNGGDGAAFDFLNTYLHYLLTFAPRYCSESISEDEQRALDTVTRMLRRLGQSARGAGELLNFGYQIIATRR